MIELEDSIEIKTTINELFNWFINLDKNFVEWHPNHKKFEKVTGGDDVGDMICFEECINGVLYRIKGEITAKEKTESSFSFEFKTMSGIGNILFTARTAEHGCIFTHVETFGLKTPIVGRALNYLLFNVLARKKANWASILQDMKEDNKNLKRILEKQVM
ncbi:MAG: SRPBCC family protein [Candidatus Bathyarchaeia archaeon]|jgi:hypothetical protein